MRLLGIDYGKKRIGLAFSEGFFPSPLSVILLKTQAQALLAIAEECKKLDIEKIVIGISKGTLAKETRIFGGGLSKITEIPVVFIDETLTSKVAIQKMIEGKTSKKKRKIREDAAAAALILQNYLEKESV
jgi:putative Holliday junction resolvase